MPILGALLALLAAAIPLGQREQATWQGTPTRYAASGITVSITPEPCGSGRRECGVGDAVPVLRVSGGGAAGLTWRAAPVDARFFPPLRVAIGRLNRGDPHASVFIDQDGGGAHCCQELKIAIVRDGRWRLVDLGQWDMPTPAFPRDVSGDGIADLVVPDGWFYYAFGSFAESMAPPKVFNVIDGRAVDVSTRAGFAPLYRRDLARTREACVHPKPQYSPNGACAAYAANAARLGRFAAAWPEVLRAYDRRHETGPTTCRRPIGPDDTCMVADQVRHHHYPEALTAFLVERGYLPRRPG